MTTIQERLLIMILRWHDGESIWKICEYMSKRDFKHPTVIHPLLVIMLDCVRADATKRAGHKVPVVITSDWRSGDDKTHGEVPCLGVDLRAKTSKQRYFLLTAATEVGFTRKGIYCDDLHLHLDIGNLIDNVKYPRNVTWVRECPDA